MKNNKKRTGLYATIAIVAILLIALIVYLGFSKSSLSNLYAANVCNASQGYVCKGLVFDHTTGNLSLTIGQNTRSDWIDVRVIFVPSSATYSKGVPIVSWTNATALNGTLNSNSTDNLVLGVSGKTPIGTKTSGSIWSQYQLNAGGTFYYAKIGNVTITAT